MHLASSRRRRLHPRLFPPPQLIGAAKFIYRAYAIADAERPDPQSSPQSRRGKVDFSDIQMGRGAGLSYRTVVQTNCA